MKRAGMILLAILVFAFLVRFLLIFAMPINLEKDQAYYDEVAQNILRGDGFRFEGRYTALRGAGYPLFLAAIYGVFGRNIFAVQLIQVLISTASCWLIYFTARKIQDEAAGLIAAGLAAVSPSFTFMYFGPFALVAEPLTILLFLLYLHFVLFHLPEGGWKYATAIGALLGLLVITKGTFLLSPLALLAYLTVGSRDQHYQAIRKFAFIAVTAMMVMAPWTFRNYLRFGHFIPSSTVGGHVFHAGNNPESHGIGSHLAPLSPELGRLNEYEESQAYFRMGLNYLMENKREIPRLVGLKIVRTFDFMYKLRPGSLPIFNAHFVFIASFVPAGLWVLFKRKELGTAYFLLFNLAIFLFYAILIMGNERYRIYMVPIFIILASVGLSYLSKKWPSNVSRLFLGSYVLILGILTVSFPALYAALKAIPR